MAVGPVNGSPSGSSGAASCLGDDELDGPGFRDVGDFTLATGCAGATGFCFRGLAGGSSALDCRSRVYATGPGEAGVGWDAVTGFERLEEK